MKIYSSRFSITCLLLRLFFPSRLDPTTCLVNILVYPSAELLDREKSSTLGYKHCRRCSERHTLGPAKIKNELRKIRVNRRLSPILRDLAHRLTVMIRQPIDGESTLKR